MSEHINHVLSFDVEHYVDNFGLVDLPERVAVWLAWTELIQLNDPVITFRFFQEVLDSYYSLRKIIYKYS